MIIFGDLCLRAENTYRGRNAPEQQRRQESRTGDPHRASLIGKR